MRRRRGIRRAGAVLSVAAAVVALAGCGLTVPSDPDGTLERASGAVLRVGASPSPGLVVIDGAAVTGPLADLARGFADEIDADIAWTVGSEEDLVSALEARTIDLAIGGMTEDTPWVDRASVTRGYTRVPGAEGRPVVVLLPLGENALQSAVERYLDSEVGP